MLLRRLRHTSGQQDLVCVGTSATISTTGGRDRRRVEIAEAGTHLFGVKVVPDTVVDESLRRVTSVDPPADAASTRAAVEAPRPGNNVERLRTHPLAAWVETTFGITTDDGRLVRREPVTIPWGPLTRRMMPVAVVYFCYGWTLWLFLSWLPLYFQHNYHMVLKDSALFSAGVFFAGVIGDTAGGLITDGLTAKSVPGGYLDHFPYLGVPHSGFSTPS